MAGSFSRVAAIKAAAIMTLSTYITIALGLVVSAVLARSLGPTDYGRYAYTLWIVGLLISFGNHGIPITGTRFISEGLGRNELGAARSLHRWLKQAQWISVTLIALAFTAALPFFQPVDWRDQTLFFASICLLSFVPKAIFQLDVSVAKGYGAFWVEAWGNMMVSGLYTTGVIVLALSHATLTANLLWFAAISMTHLLIISPLLRKARIETSSTPLPDTWRSKLKHHMGWTSLQVFIAAMSNRTIETYLISRLIGPAEVGYFAIATNLARGGIELLSSSFSTLLMPSLAHAKGAGGIGEVKRIMSDATRYFFFLGLFLAGVGVLWSGPLIHLMYSQKYEAVVPVLQVMVLLAGVLLFENPFSSTLLIMDDQRVRTALSVGFFALSAIAAVILVPTYGLMGAVAANGVSKFITAGICATYVSRHIAFSPPWKDLRRITLSAAVAALVSFGILQWSSHLAMQWLAGLTYALTFIGTASKLGIWKRHDIGLMLSLAQRKPGLFTRWIPVLQRWQNNAEA
jgi:O-antigen/teichoic acid export membrane protein